MNIKKDERHDTIVIEEDVDRVVTWEDHILQSQPGDIAAEAADKDHDEDIWLELETIMRPRHSLQSTSDFIWYMTTGNKYMFDQFNFRNSVNETSL